MRNFTKINPGEITKSLAQSLVGESCSSREFLTSQICTLTLFAKKKRIYSISQCIAEYKVCLKTLLQQGISETVFFMMNHFINSKE